MLFRSPCYIDQHYPETALNMVKVLERAGCSANYNTEQTCCGLPAFHNGYRDHCKEVGSKLVLELQNNRYIVSPGGSCVSMVRNYYPEMFHNTVLHNEYKQVQKNFMELSEFLVGVKQTVDVGASMQGVAVFIDNCSAMRECGIKTAPRELLSHVKIGRAHV